MYKNRLRVVVNGVDLDLSTDIQISLNRVVDDFTDLSKRFGDFSYSFEIPQTKNNNTVFQFANAKGRKSFFKTTRKLPCLVYNNDSLILDGVIDLDVVTRNSYRVVLYSKLIEFADTVGEKMLKELNFPIYEDFNYETTIVNHINSDYKSSDETFWQFPLVYYSTFYTAFDVYDGLNDDRNNPIDQETYPYQQYMYLINNATGKERNRFYHHQFPPSFYIVSVLKQIFNDAGWRISGQFIEDENVKKIVMLYGGNNDIYDAATGLIAGSTSIDVQPAKFLPEMKQLEFLNGIVNMFNLYADVDVQNKIIRFDTYNTLFNSDFNPYDITDRIFSDSVEFIYENNNNPSIIFFDAENKQVMGDNQITTGYTTNASLMDWVKISDTYYDRIFNRVGDKDSDDIDLPFGMPLIKKHYIYNDENVSGTNLSGGAHTIFLPCMSRQTPENNDNMKFNLNTGHTYVFNSEDRIRHPNKPTLMYYYGQSTNNFTNKSGRGAASNYYYVNIFTDDTINRVKIGFCSPFQLNTFRNSIRDFLSGSTETDTRKQIVATNLQLLWNVMGNSIPDAVQDKSTDYSLTFDDIGELHNTLWSKFHRDKYNRYQNSEILYAEMRMTDYDWMNMQISRPIKYNDEIYHIIAIEGYNPIENMASIKLIKIL